MSGPVKQLTIYGLEEDHPPKQDRRRPLGEIGAAVLLELLKRGALRAVEAGVVAHRVRGACPAAGARYNGWLGKRSRACCPYASSDGYAVLARLEARQLAERLPGGCWQASEAGRAKLGL